jgi:hypothetical protein
MDNCRGAYVIKGTEEFFDRDVPDVVDTSHARIVDRTRSKAAQEELYPEENEMANSYVSDEEADLPRQIQFEDVQVQVEDVFDGEIPQADGNLEEEFPRINAVLDGEDSGKGIVAALLHEGRRTYVVNLDCPPESLSAYSGGTRTASVSSQDTTQDDEQEGKEVNALENAGLIPLYVEENTHEHVEKNGASSSPSIPISLNEELDIREMNALDDSFEEIVKKQEWKKAIQRKREAANAESADVAHCLGRLIADETPPPVVTSDKATQKPPRCGCDVLPFLSRIKPPGRGPTVKGHIRFQDDPHVGVIPRGFYAVKRDGRLVVRDRKGDIPYPRPWDAQLVYEMMVAFGASQEAEMPLPSVDCCAVYFPRVTNAYTQIPPEDAQEMELATAMCDFTHLEDSMVVRNSKIGVTYSDCPFHAFVPEESCEDAESVGSDSQGSEVESVNQIDLDDSFQKEMEERLRSLLED